MYFPPSWNENKETFPDLSPNQGNQEVHSRPALSSFMQKPLRASITNLSF